MTPQQKAKQWLQNCNILDTETTGLDNHAEIVEISMIDQHGKVVLDTLVKPSRPIPPDAQRIHGITNEMVADAPTWPEIHDRVLQLITARPLVIYNKDYDIRLIYQTARLHKLHSKELYDAIYHQADCAMLAYAEHWGEWNDSRNDYKWQRLGNAAKQQGVELKGAAHRALYDCQMTLGVIQAMANAPDHHTNFRGD